MKSNLGDTPLCPHSPDLTRQQTMSVEMRSPDSREFVQLEVSVGRDGSNPQTWLTDVAVNNRDIYGVLAHGGRFVVL